MAYSALFDNVFEALNLLLIIFFTLMEQKFSYMAMAFGSSQEHGVLARVLPWLALVISITSRKVQMFYASSLC
jgi:hypothetical protein